MKESDMQDPQVFMVLVQGMRLRLRQSKIEAPEQDTEFNVALTIAVICFAVAIEMSPSEEFNCLVRRAMD